MFGFSLSTRCWTRLQGGRDLMFDNRKNTPSPSATLLLHLCLRFLGLQALWVFLALTGQLSRRRVLGKCSDTWREFQGLCLGLTNQTKKFGEATDRGEVTVRKHTNSPTVQSDYCTLSTCLSVIVDHSMVKFEFTTCWKEKKSSQEAISNQWKVQLLFSSILCGRLQGQWAAWIILFSEVSTNYSHLWIPLTSRHLNLLMLKPPPLPNLTQWKSQEPKQQELRPGKTPRGTN